jgi:carbon monoxide dehydrogenase subunit G
MSSLKIEERFSVQAPVERVWRFLLDPEQIAPCLPGAELLQIENERTFHGQMKVKVGPVTVAYQGTIELTQVDEAGRRVQMVGKGKEKGGAGSAKMTMESHLEPQPDGAVAIAVISDVELAGRIVRFGRGMIQSVSAQLFKQFAANVRQVLESEGTGEAAGETAAASAAGETGEVGTAGATGATGAAGGASAAGEAGAAGAEPATSSASEQAVPETDAGEAAREREPAEAEAAPAPEAGAEEPEPAAMPAAAEAAAPGDSAARAAPASGPISTPERAAPSTPAAPAVTPSAAGVSEPAAAPRAAQAQQARTGRELAPRTAEPVRALPLLFRALWDVITGFFKRLLGRSR